MLPVHREIAARVNRSAAPLILYVNNGAHVVDMMAEAGADVISLDHRVRLGEAAERAATGQGQLVAIVSARRKAVLGSVKVTCSV